MSIVSFRHDTRIGEATRKELRVFSSKAGQNIRALADRLGLRVDEETLPPEMSAVLLRSPRCGSASGYRIAVNSLHPPERQRWSIAHEIAHFVLHKDDPEFIAVVDDAEYGEIVPLFAQKGNSFRSNTNTNKVRRLEREADNFAAALLMAPRTVKQSVNYRRLSIVSLAREFYVSFEVVERRVAEIGEWENNRCNLSDADSLAS